MQLLPELANKIIHEVSVILNEHLIVADESGTIVASTDADRIGNFHEGARNVVRKGEKLYITPERVKDLKGVKAGINLPIKFDHTVIGVIGITGDPREVEPYADLLRKMTELIIQESYHLEQREWEQRGLEAFFYEWIFANEVDEDFIHRGQMLGISIGTPYLCILLQVHTDKEIPEPQMESNVMNWFQSQFPNGGADFLIRWGKKRFLLIKNKSSEVGKEFLTYQLDRWRRYFLNHYHCNLSFGVSKSVAKLYINQVYLEAEKALQAARGAGEILFYEDLLLDIVLAEVCEKTKEEFVNRTLQSILHNEELLDTLSAYLLQKQSIKETSKSLHIHANTLHYRLKQITELTGLDPKNTEGATLFYVALHIIGNI
ncbi:carbohydrate diacid regulator [Salinibacillus kushneri]|uniref:Carbohydrate diacid regulator n=1 Tax=Salinibacillus kushneri TaxID=237682 RepID=A0A1I0EWA5_9BACI|nr:sugar diacid recognition domain-containing protein [Salinibacillus kushneri]SET49931.1 carbohydrate diacid regulator [Salinibacillus kushneri]